MRRALVLLCAVLVGCCPLDYGAPPDLSGDDTGGGDNPPACADPLLGYSPDAAPTGPLVPTLADLGGIVAATLPPFALDTTCETVIIGFAVGPEPCELPDAIEVIHFDALVPLLPDGVPDATVAPITGPLAPTDDPSIFEARLAVHTEHAAGLTPFVGTVVRPNLCPAAMPACDGTPAMRYRIQEPWKGWSKLSDPLPGTPAGGVYGALYFGLADCGEPS